MLNALFGNRVTQAVFNFFEKPIPRIVTIAIMLALIVVGPMALQSCATLEQNPATAKLVTQYAVMKFSEQSSPTLRHQRLTNVINVATIVQGAASTSTTTLAALHDVVAGQIAKLNLSPADQLLANALVDIIAQELQTRIGSGLLKPNDIVLVSQVMQWVIDAAKMADAPVG